MTITVGTSPPDEMLNMVFTGILARTKLGSDPDPSQVQIEMVCLKVKAGSGGEDNNNNESNSSSAKSSASASATATSGGPQSASSTGAAIRGVQRTGSLAGLMGLGVIIPLL